MQNIPNKLPRSIWALGLVSLFMDSSSEMVHGLLPIFLVSILGASATTLGVLEGPPPAVARPTDFLIFSVQWLRCWLASSPEFFGIRLGRGALFWSEPDSRS